MFRVAELDNKGIAAARLNTCQGCERFDREKQVCGECGCFMDVKTKLEVYRNAKKLRNEITHCPLGKWGDKQISNIYRKIDGKELLK